MWKTNVEHFLELCDCWVSCFYLLVLRAVNIFGFVNSWEVPTIVGFFQYHVLSLLCDNIFDHVSSTSESKPLSFFFTCSQNADCSDFVDCTVDECY